MPCSSYKAPENLEFDASKISLVIFLLPIAKGVEVAISKKGRKVICGILRSIDNSNCYCNQC